jgi:hypothetical protein
VSLEGNGLLQHFRNKYRLFESLEVGYYFHLTDEDLSAGCPSIDYKPMKKPALRWLSDVSGLYWMIHGGGGGSRIKPSR